MTAEALARTIVEWKIKVAATGARAWPEWIGKTPDTKIPPKVQARIVLVWGMNDYTTGAAIVGVKPHFDHVIPLHAGGENREGNLRPILPEKHREKSAGEMRRKGKADRQRVAAVATVEKLKIPARPKAEKPIRDKLPLPQRTHDIFGRPV